MFTTICIIVFALFYIWFVFSLFSSAQTLAGGIAILIVGAVLAVPAFYLAYMYMWIVIAFGCLGLLFFKD